MSSFPDFYDPARVGMLYVPQVQQAVEAGRALGMPPAFQDRKRSLLLLVDAQVDFIHRDGALSVPGAVDDTRRTIELIFRRLDQITTIAASLDSHVPMQIFYPTWWVDAEGKHPPAWSLIRAEDLKAGRWIPTLDPEWSRHYVERLEADSRKILTIWPYHTMMGTPGHSITPALYEAIAFHAAARAEQPRFLAKGMIAKTEHYSILEPEVKVPGEPMGELNLPFISMIQGYDEVYIAGQAKSHCVLATTESLMRYFSQADPGIVRKWHVLTDAMSSVVHPEIDFEAAANEQYAAWARQGLQLMQTSDL